MQVITRTAAVVTLAPMNKKKGNPTQAFSKYKQQHVCITITTIQKYPIPTTNKIWDTGIYLIMNEWNFPRKHKLFSILTHRKGEKKKRKKK